MSAELATCPYCEGRGGNTGIGCGPAGCKVVSLNCPACGGTGKVAAEDQAAMREAIDRGRLIREDRLARGLALRAEAKRRGLTPLRLSEEERGLTWDRKSW